jgi:hypothetical protein
MICHDNHIGKSWDPLGCFFQTPAFAHQDPSCHFAMVGSFKKGPQSMEKQGRGSPFAEGAWFFSIFFK